MILKHTTHTSGLVKHSLSALYFIQHSTMISMTKMRTRIPRIAPTIPPMMAPVLSAACEGGAAYIRECTLVRPCNV